VRDRGKCQPGLPRSDDPLPHVLRQGPRTAKAHPLPPLDRERVACPLPDQPAFELRERRKHVRHRLARRCGGVDGAVEGDERPGLLLRGRHNAREVEHGSR